MPRGYPWTREPRSAHDVVLIDLGLFAQAARAQGDMLNFYRFRQVQRESRYLHLIGKGGPQRGGRVQRPAEEGPHEVGTRPNNRCCKQRYAARRLITGSA